MSGTVEAPATAERAADREALIERALREGGDRWYHTIELGDGAVTSGLVDLRKTAERLLPGDLSGRRALDVATCDGFWAFELERRGARVTSIDIVSVDQLDVLPNRRLELAPRLAEFEGGLGSKFRLARAALGSDVRNLGCSVYDLDREAIGGPVELAFIGALLLHLRDPVGALERVREVLEPGGQVLALEPISLRHTLLSPRRPLARFEPLYTEWNWWYPNLAALRALFVTAGFEEVERRGLYRPPSVKVMRQWYAGIAARKPT